jgi:hypothetical protein
MLPAAAHADSCPNAGTRGATSAHLAECRAYEQVTPPDTGAYRLHPFAAKPDGRSLYWVAGEAPGSDIGDPAPEDGGYPDGFLARREAGGWDSEWLTPTPPGANPIITSPFQPSMGSDGLLFGSLGNLVDEDQNDESIFAGATDLYRYLDGEVTLVNAAPGAGSQQGLPVDQFQAQIATPDLSSILFATRDGLVPEDTDGTIDVYVRRSDAVELVSIDTAGNPDNSGFDAQPGHDTLPGVPASPASQGLSSISDDGRTLVFRTTGSLDPADTDAGVDLYAWRDGVVTLISDGTVGEPDCDSPPDCDAVLAGIAVDGSKIYWTTAEPLVAGDVDTANDVYGYDFDAVVGSRLALATGDGDDPANPVSVTRDGHLFFATTARLGVDPPPPGSTLAIYRWDGTQIESVAALAPTDEGNPLAAGMALYPGLQAYRPVNSRDARDRPVRATADGSALAFSTKAVLDPADHDEQLDVYLWRRDAGVALVSKGGGDDHASYIAGTALLGGAASGARAIDAAATRVFFTSAEALTPAAGDNGRPKVYQWADGKVSLISASGIDAGPALYVDSSESGDHVFFTTPDALVPSDVDGGYPDVYDAAIGGGFAQAATEPSCPETCQGDVPSPITPTTAASITFRGDGNLRRPSDARVTLAVRRKAVRGVVAILRVRVPRGGTVVATGKGLRRSTRVVQRAGTYSVAVRLSRSGRMALGRRGRIGRTVRVAFRSGRATASATVRLTFASPTRKAR